MLQAALLYLGHLAVFLVTSFGTLSDVWQSQTTAQTKDTRSVAFTVPFDRTSETLVQRPYLYDSISKSFDSNNRVVLWGLGGVG